MKKLKRHLKSDYGRFSKQLPVGEAFERPMVGWVEYSYMLFPRSLEQEPAILLLCTQMRR
jgi:hypothetical protein